MFKLNNRFWFQLHGWFSLPVWVLFCFICLSGTIAVLSHELTWLTNPLARAENPNNVEARSAAELVAVVQKAYPTADVSTVVAYEPYLVNAVIFTDSDKPYAIAYVNQYTGEIQQVNEGLTFINFMRSLHGWLLFPWPGSYSIGYYLVCSMAFVMLGALVTGLIIYKHFWRAFLQPKIRTTQGKKTLLTDLHRLAGVWSIWFLIVMSATGVWYLVQAVMWHADIEIEPHAPIANIAQMPLNVAEKPVTPTTLDDALSMTKHQFPEFSLSYVMLPEHPRDTYKLYGAGEDVFFDQYSYSLAINPWTGEIEQQTSPASMNTLQVLSHIANPLHYGTIGGIWTKIIWFVFGVILSGMSITGFLIWGSRTVKASRAKTVMDASLSQGVR